MESIFMKYKNIIEGRFLSRPNRFIAHVNINGHEEVCHVKNTGRCRELLTPNAEVFLQISDNPNRKTRYDLIGVKKNHLMINMDSQVPNKVVEEWLKSNHVLFQNPVIRSEKVYGKSRFDFYVEDGERRAFIEVKGVTLEDKGVASFPDAPTERGVKHIKELQKSISDGYEAYLFFVIQMKGIHKMQPNRERHPEFAAALADAVRTGVKVLAYDCLVTADSIQIDKPVCIDLGEK